MDKKDKNVANKIIEEEQEKEIFDVMRNENADFFDTIFIFRNVCILAIALAAILLICYKLGAL